MSEIQDMQDRLLVRIEAHIKDKFELKQQIKALKKELRSYSKKLDEYVKRDCERREQINRAHEIIERQKKTLDQALKMEKGVEVYG